MGENPPGKRKPGSHQHRRPYDRVKPRDVLAYDVDVRRPYRGESLRLRRVADGRDVVQQRIHPDVGDVPVVPRERDAPERRGSRDREVTQSSLYERHHLVAAGGGADEPGPLRVSVQEAVLGPPGPERG